MSEAETCKKQQQQHPTTVAILYGRKSRSSSHEVSFMSAHFFLKSFPPQYLLLPVHIAEDGSMFRLKTPLTSPSFASWTVEDVKSLGAKSSDLYGEVVRTIILPSPLQSIPPLLNLDVLNKVADIVFPVLQGQNDGRFQGLLELTGLPYMGCDLRANVVTVDKWISKRLVQEAGGGVAPYVAVDYADWKEKRGLYLESIESVCGYPCFVKPNSCGVSIGVGRATDREDLEVKMAEAFKHDDLILVERQIGDGINWIEYIVAFSGSASRPRMSLNCAWEEPQWMSVEYKETCERDTFRNMPVTHLDEAEMESLKELVGKVVLALRPTGIARIDVFRCPVTKEFLFNEINSLPLCDFNCIAYTRLWEVSGVEHAEWIEWMVREAWERFDRVNRRGVEEES